MIARRTIALCNFARLLSADRHVRYVLSIELCCARLYFIGLLSSAQAPENRPVRSWDSTDGLTIFCREVVRLWSAAELQKSLGVGKSGQIYERVFQMQFSITASQILPPGASLHPDVSSVSGSSCIPILQVNGLLQPPPSVTFRFQFPV